MINTYLYSFHELTEYKIFHENPKKGNKCTLRGEVLEELRVISDYSPYPGIFQILYMHVTQ